MNVKTQKSVKVNLFMNMLLTMSSFIFPLITFPYVSRILLPEGTGKVSLATSFVAYFNMFAQLGIPTYGVRCCAKVRDNKEELSRTAHELLLINVVLSFFAYVALGMAILGIPQVRAERNLYIVVSSVIILQSIGMEWLYKGLEQYTYITIRSVIFKFIALIGMFILVHKYEDYVIYGGITIFAASASNILNFINARKYIYMHPVGSYNFKKHIKPTLVFFALTFAATVYTNLDNVMLGFMKADIDVGYYNASVKIKNIVISLVTSVGTVLLPRASYYIEHNLIDAFKKISNKAIRFIFVIAPPFVLFFVLYAKQTIYFLSGTAYEGSIVPMKILMPTILFIGLTNVLGMQILVPLGREKTVLYSTIAGAVVDTIINALLIPRFASVGAAIGTLIAEFVVLCWQFYALKDFVKNIFLNIRYISIIAGLLGAFVVSYKFSLIQLNNFGVLAVTGISFFATYFLLLLLMKEPLTMEVFEQLLCKIKNYNKSI